MKIETPEKQGVWLMALVLAIVSFIFYYAVAYGSLIRVYRTHGFFTPLLSGPANLDIQVAIPSYSADFEQRPILVRIVNQGDQIANDVHFTAALEWHQDGKIDSMSIAPAYQFNSSLTFKEIQPHATVLGELSLPPLTTVPTFWLNQTQLADNENLKAPVNDPARAFLLASIQRVLLPPWSNGFLVSVSVAIAWFWQGQMGRRNRPRGIGRYVVIVFATAGACVGLLMMLLSTLDSHQFLPGIGFASSGVGLVLIIGGAHRKQANNPKNGTKTLESKPSDPPLSSPPSPAATAVTTADAAPTESVPPVPSIPDSSLDSLPDPKGGG